MKGESVQMRLNTKEGVLSFHAGGKCISRVGAADGFRMGSHPWRLWVNLYRGSIVKLKHFTIKQS